MVAVETFAGPRISLQRYVHVGARRRFAPSAHAQVEIAWIDAGAASWRIGSAEHAPAPGRAGIVPAGVEHATTFAPAAGEHGRVVQSFARRVPMIPSKYRSPM